MPHPACALGGSGAVWNGVDVRHISRPQTFKDDPVLVWRYYGERMLEMLAARPNAAHRALAGFAQRWEDWLTVNQNVDGMCAHACLGM